MRRQATNQKGPSDSLDVDGSHTDDTENDDHSPTRDRGPRLLTAAGDIGFAEQDYVSFS